jgi:hypothetical protein
MGKEREISIRALLGLGGLATVSFAFYDNAVNRSETDEQTREIVIQDLQERGIPSVTRQELDAERHTLGESTQYKNDHPDELMAALRTKRKLEIQQEAFREAFAQRRSQVSPSVSKGLFILARDLAVGTAGVLSLISAVKPARRSSH